MRYFLTFIFAVMSLIIFGQNDSLKYKLLHSENSKLVTISIEFDSLHTKSSYLQIPRSAPGTYEITEYPNFIEDVTALTLNNKTITGMRGRGSIFFFREDAHISKIEYKVNITKMERELKGGFASSKLRHQYLGILGYSVFGTIPNLENKPIELTITSDANWPIFTTLKPTQHFTDATTIMVENYTTLADAQYLLGDNVQFFNIKNSEIPLIIAAYAECEINLEEIGRRALLSLQGLSKYFGYVPMPHYTLCYEFLEPLSDKHSYGFSMEHMNSMTASLTLESAITNYEPDANIGSIVHHMGHSWIPLRCYGKGYKPFDWAAAPIIETIWLNEGFIWYVMSIITDRPNVITFFERIIENAPKYIQEKSLKELSQLGSTQYSGDFNIGRNLFSRGALMAKEMDDAIRKSTNNQRSFKDALLGLLKWTEEHKRAYEYHEIEPILSASSDTNLKAIWQKWQAPIKTD